MKPDVYSSREITKAGGKVLWGEIHILIIEVLNADTCSMNGTLSSYIRHKKGDNWFSVITRYFSNKGHKPYNEYYFKYKYLTRSVLYLNTKIKLKIKLNL